MPRKGKKQVLIDVPVDGPVVEHLITEAHILRFEAPLFGSFVFLPDMLCAECQQPGVFCVSVRCLSCHKTRVNRFACARSNVDLVHAGHLLVHTEVFLCRDCGERDDDTAPPIAGGVLGVPDSSRLN